MVQCALNGGYGRDDHPEVPVTLEQIVADAVACREAGSGSVHLHPRRRGDGRESLSAAVHDAVVAAVRAATGDLEVSCSTAEDIDLGDAADRVAAIRGWQCPPDVVSLNLAEHGTIELGAALVERGVGIEAGVFTLADADRLLAAPWARDVRRVLVETIFEHDDAQAVALAHAIDERVRELGRPGSGTATGVPTGRWSTPAWTPGTMCESVWRTRSWAATAAGHRATPRRWPTLLRGE